MRFFGTFAGIIKRRHMSAMLSQIPLTTHIVVQQLAQANSTENITRAPHHWPFTGESTDHCWISITKDSNADSDSMSWSHHVLNLCNILRMFTRLAVLIESQTMWLFWWLLAFQAERVNIACASYKKVRCSCKRSVVFALLIVIRTQYIAWNIRAVLFLSVLFWLYNHFLEA